MSTFFHLCSMLVDQKFYYKAHNSLISTFTISLLVPYPRLTKHYYLLRHNWVEELLEVRIPVAQGLTYLSTKLEVTGSMSIGAHTNSKMPTALVKSGCNRLCCCSPLFKMSTEKCFKKLVWHFY